MIDIAKIAAASMRRMCRVCFGKGRLQTYRGPQRSLPCHFCDGTGHLKEPTP